MKYLILMVLSIMANITCLADTNRVAPETKWTHSWSEGEDATSTFYYFIEDKGQVTRMRMMWNGGAQNKPSVTDYIFESGAIRIITQESTRENIEALVKGENTGLKVVSETKILRRHTGMMMVPEPPRKTLNQAERVHLNNILDLLLQDRTKYKK